VLEYAGVRLSCVATEVMGVSGRQMMRSKDKPMPTRWAEAPVLRKALDGRDMSAFPTAKHLASWAASAFAPAKTSPSANARTRKAHRGCVPP